MDSIKSTLSPTHVNFRVSIPNVYHPRNLHDYRNNKDWLDWILITRQIVYLPPRRTSYQLLNWILNTCKIQIHKFGTKESIQILILRKNKFYQIKAIRQFTRRTVATRWASSITTMRPVITITRSTPHLPLISTCIIISRPVPSTDQTT